MKDGKPLSGVITPADIDGLYVSVANYGTEQRIHVTKMAVMLKILSDKLMAEHDIKIEIFERSEHLQ